MILEEINLANHTQHSWISKTSWHKVSRYSTKLLSCGVIWIKIHSTMLRLYTTCTITLVICDTIIINLLWNSWKMLKTLFFQLQLHVRCVVRWRNLNSIISISNIKHHTTHHQVKLETPYIILLFFPSSFNFTVIMWK